jgi:hypothetical protein
MKWGKTLLLYQKDLCGVGGILRPAAEFRQTGGASSGAQWNLSIYDLGACLSDIFLRFRMLRSVGRGPNTFPGRPQTVLRRY